MKKNLLCVVLVLLGINGLQANIFGSCTAKLAQTLEKGWPEFEKSRGNVDYNDKKGLKKLQDFTKQINTVKKCISPSTRDQQQNILNAHKLAVNDPNFAKAFANVCQKSDSIFKKEFGGQCKQAALANAELTNKVGNASANGRNAGANPRQRNGNNARRGGGAVSRNGRNQGGPQQQMGGYPQNQGQGHDPSQMMGEQMGGPQQGWQQPMYPQQQPMMGYQQPWVDPYSGMPQGQMGYQQEMPYGQMGGGGYPQQQEQPWIDPYSQQQQGQMPYGQMGGGYPQEQMYQQQPQYAY